MRVGYRRLPDPNGYDEEAVELHSRFEIARKCGDSRTTVDRKTSGAKPGT